MNPGTCGPRNGGGSVGGRRVVKKSAVTGLSLWALCVFAVPLASRANEAGRVLPERVQLSNVAHFTAEAQTDVQQDRLVLSMSTARQGSDASQVQAQLKSALDSALAEAKKRAAPEQMEVRTGVFGLSPRYGQDGKISGWQGSAELILEGRDFRLITGTASQIQTLTIARGGFSLSPEQSAIAQARVQAQAIENFKRKAGELTRSFGFSGYSLREVTISQGESGLPQQPRLMAARMSVESASVPVEAGKTQVSVSVSGSVQMK